MIASYLIYQLVDLAFAALGTWLALRGLRAPRVRRFVAGHPGFATTPLRELALVALPLSGLVFGGFVLVSFFVLQPLLGWICFEFWQWPVSVKYLGVGAAWYAWLWLFPALAVARAWRAPAGTPARRSGVDRALACAGVVASAAFYVDATFVEPSRLTVETTRIELAEWPAGSPTLRVVLLADLQSPLLGEHERRIVARVRELAPDLILIPGDLVAQSFDDELPLACARYLLDGIDARLGVYVVNGDCDQFVAGGIRRSVAGTKARLLENESVRVDVGGFSFELAGFDALDPEGYARACAAWPLAELRVALVHQPEHARTLAPAGFDLVLAGHTHGGQIVLPGFGPLVTASPLDDELDAGGLHDFTPTTRLYVSRGLGMEGGFAPPMRFFCPPEISLLLLGPVAR